MAPRLPSQCYTGRETTGRFPRTAQTVRPCILIGAAIFNRPSRVHNPTVANKIDCPATTRGDGQPFCAARFRDRSSRLRLRVPRAGGSARRTARDRGRPSLAWRGARRRAGLERHGPRIVAARRDVYGGVGQCPSKRYRRATLDRVICRDSASDTPSRMRSRI